MVNYDDIKDEEFDDLLDDVLNTMSMHEITSISGVYEILKEELNNEVLELWESSQDYLKVDIVHDVTGGYQEAECPFCEETNINAVESDMCEHFDKMDDKYFYFKREGE